MLRFSLVDAKLYRGVPGATATTLCNTCKDVGLKVGRSEAKISSRASSWELSAAVMKAGEFDIEFNDDSTDEHLAAFLAAAVADWPDNVVSCFITDGAEGLDADFCVMNMERSEKLEEQITYKFTLKPTLFSMTHLPTWAQVPAEPEA